MNWLTTSIAPPTSAIKRPALMGLASQRAFAAPSMACKSCPFVVSTAAAIGRIVFQCSTAATKFVLCNASSYVLLENYVSFLIVVLQYSIVTAVIL